MNYFPYISILKDNRVVFNMDYRVIKTEEEYNRIIGRIEEIMDAEPDTPEGDELELLALLVEKYEEENVSLSPSGTGLHPDKDIPNVQKEHYFICPYSLILSSQIRFTGSES
ncbi:MAG: hypothetical protein AB2L24_09950 [Mangrovibacterium sp.]